MARKVALLIGVSEYGSGLKALRCPVNGVRTLQRILENPDTGGFDEVIGLENPDVGTMRARIGEVFGQLTKRDLIMFYFTGHGLKDMTGNFYLTTRQTQLFDNGQLNPGTAIEAEFLKRVLTNCLAERKVIILDCCFGAAFADGFLSMDEGRVDVDAQLGGKGWCLLTAATSNRYALEQEGADLSVYTQYLVKGLQTGGAAPAGHDLISVRHLHDYVLSNVNIAAPAMAPAIFNAQQGDEIILAKVQLEGEQIYRQQVQSKVREGSIRPSAKSLLQQWQSKLGLSDTQAQEIETEVLKPYREKQAHLEMYAEALEAEKAYMLGLGQTMPLRLEADAVQDLKDLQQLFNLRDQDVQAVEKRILGEVVEGVEKKQPVKSEFSVSAVVKPKPPEPYPTFSFETVQVNDQGKVIETIPTKAEYFAEDLGNGILLEMVRIPGGQFMMGAAQDEAGARGQEYPQHEVTVSEFWMGKFAVTQAQWQIVVGSKRVERDLNLDPARFKGAKRPVEQVRWADAMEFCQRLSQQLGREYRLPSEAEWEYACRAGTTTPFYFGPTMTTEWANYDGNSTYGQGPKGTYRQETMDVGSFPPNSFGLYDMHGNTWEWCLDGWHDSYKEAPVDGSAWTSSSNSKVMRGGSWHRNPANCRAANRDSIRFGYDSVGFRVVSKYIG